MAVISKGKLPVTIIGGGLAGLISAILLNRCGFQITLVEKKHYPFHRVCGEYLSNEVIPFLKSLGINLLELNPSHITELAMSSASGKIFKTKLDLGGIGISRFKLDHFLYQKAVSEGVNFILGLKANEIRFKSNEFEVTLEDNRVISSTFVIASHGKRSNLDKERAFFYQRSPYIGVKYHIKTDFPRDLIQLDNFKNGYCGTVKVENERYCLCYLSRKENLKAYGNLSDMEESVLFKNPNLKYIFRNSEFLYEKPEVINEISFARKTLVEDHVLFCGDSAGMISPLCGNGMAMAIHSSKILCDTLTNNYSAGRAEMERIYVKQWNKQFARRLLVGRLSQHLFSKELLSELAINSLHTIKPLSNFILGKTHGNPF